MHFIATHELTRGLSFAYVVFFHDFEDRLGLARLIADGDCAYLARIMTSMMHCYSKANVGVWLHVACRLFRKLDALP